MKFQIAVDCADPHLLAAFWAEVMDLTVEADPDFVQQMVDEGHAQASDTVTVDGVLHWATGAAVSNEDKSVRIYFQQVPEPKTAKNRVHLDLRVPDGQERADVVARVLELGGSELYEGSQGPYNTWVTMADPEGNELCVA